MATSQSSYLFAIKDEKKKRSYQTGKTLLLRTEEDIYIRESKQAANRIVIGGKPLIIDKINQRLCLFVGPHYISRKFKNCKNMNI